MNLLPTLLADPPNEAGLQTQKDNLKHSGFEFGQWQLIGLVRITSGAKPGARAGSLQVRP